MSRFSDFGVVSCVIIGKGIDIEELFGRRVLIEKTIILPTKFPGKNSSGLRLQMQVVLATFNEQPDDKGDYYQKDASGNAIGERRSCFTGSDNLISSIQQVEEKMINVNKNRKDGEPQWSVYPIETTIVKVGKCFQFT